MMGKLLVVVLAGMVGWIAMPLYGQVSITALSTDAARVTGGDVLVQVAVGPATRVESLKITVGGRDVTAAFHPGKKSGVLMGLVTGLVDGANVIRAGDASLEVTNYPISGP